jgi:hypothetical protein
MTTKNKALAVKNTSKGRKARQKQEAQVAPAEKTLASSAVAAVTASEASAPVTASEASAPVTASEASAPVTAPVKAQVDRDAFGNRRGTRAHAINAILFGAALANDTKTLRLAEIENAVHASEEGRAYAKANNKQIGAIRNHLQSLLALKLVTLDKGAWRVVEGATKAQRLLVLAAEAEARAAQLAAEAPKA